MKQILIILGLFASVTTFAQSPRIKLNQITKDTVKGSVLISSPSDSGMVYSRDFYIAYGADTVLILYGDTLAATSGIISSVLSDGVTITGDGTTGNELKVDTLLIATIKALNDSLATISASTTPDGVTITGDGSVGNPLKVDTLLISTIKGLVDTLTNRGYLTANQTITLSGDVTGSGTTAITATVVDDSHDHIISNVDFLQDSLNAKANDSDLANYVTLSGTDTITGAKTFTNTFTQSGGDANFDSGTLFVDESANRVGIGTSSPDKRLHIKGDNTSSDIVFETGISYTTKGYFAHYQGATLQLAINRDITGVFSNTGAAAAGINLTGNNGDGNFTVYTSATNNTSPTLGLKVDKNQNVGIGNIFTPSEKLDVNGKVRIRNLTGTGTNDVLADANGVLGTSSDERLKIYDSDITDAISIVKGLYPKYYYWKDNAVKRDLGFYAQEVNAVLPEGATPMNNDGFYGLNSRAIIAVTVKAIQEQQAIIETQEQKITDLETTIQALITRIENLENK